MSNVCVIGDEFIDQYVVGTSNRTSPEAPVPVMIVEKKYALLGGAANVWANMKIESHYIDNDNQGLNTKTRYICNGKQVLRIDNDGYKEDQVLLPRKYALAVVSDYNKGNIIDFEYIRSMTDFQIVDAKKDFDEYHGATIVKCNEAEYLRFSKFPLTKDGMEQAKQHYRINTIIVTRAEKPVMVSSFTYYEVLVPETEVVDVTGAGDVFLAVFASIWWDRGQDTFTAVRVAAKAASISCGHIGTYTVTKREYESCFH